MRDAERFENSVQCFKGKAEIAIFNLADGSGGFKAGLLPQLHLGEPGPLAKVFDSFSVMLSVHATDYT